MRIRDLTLLFVLVLGVPAIAHSQEPDKLTPLAPNAPQDQPGKANVEEGKFDEVIKPYVEQARKTYPEAKARFLAGLPAKHVFFTAIILSRRPN